MNEQPEGSVARGGTFTSTAMDPVLEAEAHLATVKARRKRERKQAKREERARRERERQVALATATLESAAKGESCAVDQQAQVEAARLLLQANGVIA